MPVETIKKNHTQITFSLPKRNGYMSIKNELCFNRICCNKDQIHPAVVEVNLVRIRSIHPYRWSKTNPIKKMTMSFVNTLTNSLNALRWLLTAVKTESSFETEVIFIVWPNSKLLDHNQHWPLKKRSILFKM
ncbi:unnamed protein product [Albugo candida]|uniref:Uncharacterized protein n=1 Tax=Albugo candida TaxID=65357 RepID=A0A024FV94_9STRA|nr:unnamed protein product [Albugo candida]|eukprot:CCI10569.1 unnamed protein product [Albugo candida]